MIVVSERIYYTQRQQVKYLVEGDFQYFLIHYADNFEINMHSKLFDLKKKKRRICDDW